MFGFLEKMFKNCCRDVKQESDTNKYRCQTPVLIGI